MTPEEIISGKVEVKKSEVGTVERLVWLREECVKAQSRARALGNELVTSMRVLEQLIEEETEHWGRR